MSERETHDPRSGTLKHSDELRSRGNFDGADNRSIPYASEMSGEAVKPLGKPASETPHRARPEPIGKGSRSPVKAAGVPQSSKRPPGFRQW
jgi:hypothetical protein